MGFNFIARNRFFGKLDKQTDNFFFHKFPYVCTLLYFHYAFQFYLFVYRYWDLEPKKSYEDF